MSCFAKLLAIPAVIWAQTHSAIYLLLTNVLVFTSNVAAFRGWFLVGLIRRTLPTLGLAANIQWIILAATPRASGHRTSFVLAVFSGQLWTPEFYSEA